MIYVELLIVFSAFVYAVIKPPKQSLCLMFLLLPIHGTIKNVIFWGGGAVFAGWKEIIITIVFLKTLNISNSFCNKNKSIVFAYLLFITFFLLEGIFKQFEISSEIKKLFFPIVFMLALTKITWSPSEYLKLFRTIFIGSVLINITGIIDFISPTYSFLFKDIMHVGYKISGDDVYFDTSSYSIMGFNRICGLMEGGPNQFGVFNCGVLLICLMTDMYLKPYLKKWDKSFLFCTALLCTFCLITSFSRAGWAMFFLTVLILGLNENRYRKKIVQILVLSIFVVSFFIVIEPKIGLVLDATFSGKEASAASRSSMTSEALSFLLNNPWGNGLGASGHDAIYFAESALINIGIDIGVLGLAVLCVLIFSIYKGCYQSPHYFAKISAGFTLAYLFCSLVSVNPFENPFIYYAWLIMSLPLAYDKHKINSYD